MDVIESLRTAMRVRILDAGIVTEAEYQREWLAAPADASLYIRETVTEYTREEDSQGSELITVLCEYDVFVKNRAFPNPMAKVSDIGSQIIAEFDRKDADKIIVALDGWTGPAAAVSRVNYGTPSQEEEWFRLPVLLYVEIHFPAGAEYEDGESA